MNTRTTIGAILIVLGMIGLVYGGITYYSNTNVIEMGEIRLQVDERERIPLSPVAGAAAVLVGVFLLVGSKRGRDSKP